MGILHLVNRSPGESLALAQCLDRTGRKDALLLLESGVYAVVRNCRLSSRLAGAMAAVNVYALAPDLEARGIAREEILPGVTTVDYEGFVDLCLRHSPIQSWS